MEPVNATCARGRDFDVGLVCHELDQNLVLADLVPFAHLPFDNFRLHDAFTNVGQFKPVHFAFSLRMPKIPRP
jgi:hypothetical protein